MGVARSSYDAAPDPADADAALVAEMLRPSPTPGNAMAIAASAPSCATGAGP